MQSLGEFGTVRLGGRLFAAQKDLGRDWPEMLCQSKHVQ